jgi:perosamine synthetase
MKIPPTKVTFSLADREEILHRIDDCLSSGHVDQGQNVDEFERAFAQYIGCRFAVALSSGGSALEIAMRALGVAGRCVLVPTNTFFATAAAVLLAGGWIRLVDISADTIAPTVDTLDSQYAKDVGGVIVVHIGGIVTPEIERIREWCAQRRIWLFEDCAHAHGSELMGQRAGRFGIGGAYSFFSTKVITSGEGGMLVTDNESLAQKARLFRNYGKPDPWVTVSVELGANCRMNELAAAVGVVHLKRLDDFITSREKIAARYTDRLRKRTDLSCLTPSARSSWYKYIVVLPPSIRRDYVRQAMKEAGVNLPGGVYDLPLHRQPVFRGQDWGRFPVAESFCDRHICLPIFYEMSLAEADYVLDALEGAIQKNRLAHEH